jgi:hypothetical protein
MPKTLAGVLGAVLTLTSCANTQSFVNERHFVRSDGLEETCNADGIPAGNEFVILKDGTPHSAVVDGLHIRRLDQLTAEQRAAAAPYIDRLVRAGLVVDDHHACVVMQSPAPNASSLGSDLADGYVPINCVTRPILQDVPSAGTRTTCF